ncbi:tetratricopeptide repeat protein [Treponema pedis]|uniref:tetratricopeptide repeat protein n=1 Tax=Treponema pedis TaxID=409322 RepID=UPI00040A2BE5|nr:hypothetical protein [Treponema pedis]
MKKMLLFVFAAVCLFYSCASVKKSGNDTASMENITESGIKPETSETGGTEKEKKDLSEKIEQKKPDDKALPEKSGVVNNVPPSSPITDRPDLELIIPSNDDEHINEESKILEKPKPASKPKEEQKKEKKKVEKTSPEADKKQLKPEPPLKPKKEVKPEKNSSEQVEKSSFPEKADSERLENTGHSFETEPPKEERRDERDMTAESASEDNSEDKKNTYNDDKSPQVFSEFPSTEPEETKESRVSRNVKMYTGQKLEITYPGEGWVYLGETTAQRGLKYGQRKIQDGASVFNFSAETAGSYILNFSYFDVFSDEFISDSVAVNVEPSKEKLSNTVRAPEYKGAVITRTENLKPKQKSEEKENMEKNEISSTVSSAPMKSEPEKEKMTTVSDSPQLTASEENGKGLSKTTASPQDLLERTKKFIAEGNAASALSTLDEFFKNYTERQDEGWFFRGQAYELNGKEKNIKEALKAYETLTEAFPESSFWNQADTRIRYIKKFYVNVD